MRAILLRSGFRFGDILVALSVVALILIGAFQDVRIVRQLRPSLEGPNSTTDVYLAHLGAAPTATIMRSLQSSRDGALVFSGWFDEPTFVATYYGLGVLTLPRQLGEVGCALSGRPPNVLVPSDPNVPVAGRLCYIVGCGSGATLITPDLALNTSSIVKPYDSWQSLCQP